MVFNGKVYTKYSSTLCRILRAAIKHHNEITTVDYKGFCSLLIGNDVEVLSDTIQIHIFFLSIIRKVPRGKIAKVVSTAKKYHMLYDLTTNMLDRALFPNKSYQKESIYEYLRWVFGEEYFSEVRKHYTQKSIYDVNAVSISQGISLVEAENVVAKRKAKTSGSLDRYVLKYGEEEGGRRYNQFKERCSTSLRAFTLRHGVLGREKYLERNRRQSISISTKALIEKLGEEAAIKVNKSKGRTKAQLIESFGEDKAETIIKKRSASFIPKTKGSKKSLKYLLPVKHALISRGIPSSHIKLGYLKQREYSIGKYYYDFTILPLKVIIEYNGLAWHPKSPNDTSWKHPYGSKTAKEAYDYEQKKLSTARDNGFKVIVIWEDNELPLHELLEKIYES